MKHKNIERVEEDYKKSLEQLVNFKDDALKQIEENPFLRRKWSWIDCIMAGVPMSRMPKTPYQEMIDLTNKRFREDMEQLKLNVMAKIEAIYE